jgi:outer membrane biosynthesis protein TonB
MLETLNRYIEEQPSRGVADRVRLWLRNERVFARLLVVSAILHIVFYAGIILLNVWEMRRIKLMHQQAGGLELITEIAPPPSSSRLRTPTVALERADVRRFEYDPQNANDTDLIARSPNPSTQRGSKGTQPSATQVEAQINRTRGGGQENRPGPVSAQPPVIASVPSTNALPPTTAAATTVPPGATPSPPAPRPAPAPSSEAAAGTQRGTGSESTSFGTQRISAQYIAFVRSKVSRVNEAYMPRDFVNTTLGGEVSADFIMVLDRSGRIVRLTLERPSGFKALDATARQAIVNASPFEGYPQTAGDTITLTVTVYYHPSR